MIRHVHYLALHDNQAGSGVTRKLLGQARSLAEAGAPCTLHLMGATRAGLENESCVRFHPVITPPYRSLWRAQRSFRQIAGVLRGLLAEAGPEDVVFLRKLQSDPFFWRALRRPRVCRVVSEHQSLEVEETRVRPLQNLFERALGGAMRRRLDGIIGVTDEITAHEQRRARPKRLPGVTIANGIRVADFPVRPTPPWDGTALELIAVGRFNRWHALDRVVEGLARHVGTCRCRLHVVGDGAAVEPLRAQAAALGVGERVLFHGFMGGAGLDSLFTQAHAAIGSLGHHRLRMREACSLKLREYCARGLPFVLAHDDPDFHEHPAFAFRAPSTDESLDIAAIVDWFAGLAAAGDAHSRVRAYAESRLDWLAKMRRWVAFVESLPAP